LYVIRDNDAKNYDEDYASRGEEWCLVQPVCLISGSEFDDDNQQVYSMLSDYIKDIIIGKALLKSSSCRK
jgi:hypothetical protein